MSKKKTFLADQLAVLSNPTPQFDDPEEGDDLYTRARLDDQYEEDEDDNIIIAQSSTLRRKNADSLASIDEKYSGKPVSRKELQQDLNESEQESDGSVHGDNFPNFLDLEYTANTNVIRDVDDKNQSHTSNDVMMFTEELHHKDDNDEDEDESGDSDDEEGSEEEEEGSEERELESEEEELRSEEGELGSEEEELGSKQESEGPNLMPFTHSDMGVEAEKGHAAKMQLGLWDSFMELRIKLQKALVTSNQIPQCDTFPNIMAEGGQDLQKAQSKAKNEVKSLLDTLLELQESLLQQNPETRHVLQGGKPIDNTSEDDEEIASDEDIPSDDEPLNGTKENAEDTSIEPNSNILLRKKKRKLEDYEEILCKRQKHFKEFRDMTLQKWHDKTKVASGRINSKSFSSFDRSVLKQIEQILVDQDRLLKRTQLKRTVYNVVGKKDEKVEKADEEESKDDIPVQQNSHLKDYDCEIYDDDDFYHQMLRELIEKRTAGTTDPIQLTRQWLEVQKLRSKIRKKVDTKASKGRKIRYGIHQKLVSFMAPDEMSPMSDESRTELYKSLFGGKYNTGKASSNAGGDR